MLGIHRGGSGRRLGAQPAGGWAGSRPCPHRGFDARHLAMRSAAPWDEFGVPVPVSVWQERGFLERAQRRCWMLSKRGWLSRTLPGGSR